MDEQMTRTHDAPSPGYQEEGICMNTIN